MNVPAPTGPEPTSGGLRAASIVAVAALAGVLAMTYVVPSNVKVNDSPGCAPCAVAAQTLEVEKAIIAKPSRSVPKASYDVELIGRTPTAQEQQRFAELRSIVQEAVAKDPSLIRLQTDRSSMYWQPVPEVIARYNELADAAATTGQARDDLRAAMLAELLSAKKN